MKAIPDARSWWPIDPSITFLNHGSFGSCPKAVLEIQTRLRAELEAEPISFFLRELEDRLDAARAVLGAFVGADAEGIAFVSNATSGVNAVLRSLDFAPGDELLVTDHGYAACKNALDFVADRTGAKTVVARVPFPIDSPERVTEAILAAATPKTKLAMVDHITSPTGIVFPIAAIVRALAERGIDTIVDGAHAPGMVPLDVRAIGAAYYTGNCHKWVCAPKGAAFLWARPDRRAAVRPLTISHGATSQRTDRSRYLVEFDWTGTDDPTPALCVPEAIRFLESKVPGGWPAIMERNRALALEARRILCEALRVPLPSPDEMIGSLAAMPLPDGRAPLAGRMDPLWEMLFRDHQIEVPVMPWPAHPKRLLRISAALYNDVDQYRALAAAVVAALG